MAQNVGDFDNLECVVQPTIGEVQFDVVAVHGLSSNWQTTWSDLPQSRSWLQDLLPKEIPNARIWTCGFDVRKYIRHGLITSHSKSLLNSFITQREDPKRPIIFIAHSLGGVILQAALQESSISLRASIHGIVFLGLPQLGVQEKKWEQFFLAIDKIVDQTLPFDQTGLKNVLPLGLINVGFTKWLSQQPFAQRVICFYEVLPFDNIGIIVDRDSAIIPQCDAIALDANHLSMSKFSRISDNQYQTVVQSLRMMCCLVGDNKVLMRRSLAGPSHGRLRKMPITPDGCEELIASSEGGTEAKRCGRLALMLEDQGCYGEALDQYSSAADYYKASLGDTHRLTLFCLDKRALLLRDRGQYKEAESLGRWVLESRIDVFGKRDLCTLFSCGNLTLTLMNQGRHQAAYSLLRDGLESSNFSLQEVVSQVKLLDVLAKVATERGMYDTAEAIACDVVRTSISTYGEGHPFTLNRMSDLALAMAWKNHFIAAEAITRHALGGLEQALGKNHPDSLRASQRLADYICCQRRYNDAAMRLERTLKAQKRKSGTHHPDTLLTMSSLGNVYALQGYLKDAEELLSRAHAGQVELMGPENHYTMRTLDALTSVETLQQWSSSQFDSSDVERPSVWLEYLGFKSWPSPEHYVQIDKHISSPFTKTKGDGIINAAITGDLTRLQTSLSKRELDAYLTGRALRQAAASGQNEVIKLLLDTDLTDVSIDAQGGFYGTAIQAASFAGKETTVELLLSRNADINMTGGIFGNAIRAAILRRQTKVLQLLLKDDRASDIDTVVVNSSLQIAIATKQERFVAQLLDIGADVNAKDNLFGSPIQQASFGGQENLMALLIRRGADVNMQAGVFKSPLQAAIASTNRSTVKLLLDSGALVRRIYFEPGNKMTDEQRAIHEELLEKIMLEVMEDSKEPFIYSPTQQVTVPSLTDIEAGSNFRAQMDTRADPPLQVATERQIITDAEAAQVGFQIPIMPNLTKIQSEHTAKFSTSSSSSKTSRVRRCVIKTSHNVKERILSLKQQPKRHEKRYIATH